MTKDEVLNIAIDYMNERLEEHDAKFQRHPVAEAERNNILADIEAVKEALAQPEPWEKFCDSNCVWTDHHPDCKLAEQEPVAFVKGCNRGQWEIFPAKAYQIFEREQPLYTTPPQRKPLTDEEIILIVAECAASHQHTDIHFARAIEAAHGIKELV